MIRKPLWPVFLHSSASSGRAPLPEILLCFSVRQVHWGAPLAGILRRRSAHQSLKGARWVGSYSVVQCVRRLMGQPPYCSASDAGVWGERGYDDGPTLYTWLSSITLLPWLPGFSPQAFPTTISSLTSPPSVSCAFQETSIPVRGVWLWQGLSDSHSI